MHAEAPDIEASALVSAEGLLIASAMPPHVDAEVVGAMSAAMVGMGDRIGDELDRGDLVQVFVRCKGGSVILIRVGDEAVLTALAKADAQLGLVFVTMRGTASSLLSLLDSCIERDS